MAAPKSERRGGTRQRRRDCRASASVRALGAGSGVVPVVLNRLGRSGHRRSSATCARRSHAPRRISVGAVRLKPCVRPKVCWNTRGRIAGLSVKTRRKKTVYERTTCRIAARLERRQRDAAWPVFNSDEVVIVGNRGQSSCKRTRADTGSISVIREIPSSRPIRA